MASAASPDPGPDLARCAFVSLVMRGDAYVPGALVCAHSLRLAGTRARLVCMVTACVSALARRRLACVWDEVVEVPALRFECRKLVSVKQRRMYEQWVETSFTKWNCLALTQFEKLVFIDADKVVLANCDELFSLHAPAGTFSSPWAWPFNTKGEGIPNPYALSCAQHGDAVPPAAIRAALDGGSFVVVGTMLLLRPCARTYSDLLAYCARAQPIGRAGCVSMMDEQAITAFFVDERPDTPWTFIHQRYNYISWHRSWLDDDDQPKVFHYFGSKVWNIPRTDFLGADVWWQFAVALCADDSDESGEAAALHGAGGAENANESSSVAEFENDSTLLLLGATASELIATKPTSSMRDDGSGLVANVEMIPESIDIATTAAGSGDCTRLPATSSFLSPSSPSASSSSSLSSSLSRLHSLSRSALLRGAFDAALLALPRVAAAPVGCVWCESCGVDDTAHHLVNARAAISCPRLLPPPPLPVVPVVPPPSVPVSNSVPATTLLTSVMPTTTMDAIAADSAVEAAAETVLAAAVANSTQASPLSSSAGVAVSPPLSLAHISASAAAPSEHSDSNGGDQASSQNDREDGADSGIHPTKRQRREEPFDASDSAPQ